MYLSTKFKFLSKSFWKVYDFSSYFGRFVDKSMNLEKLRVTNIYVHFIRLKLRKLLKGVESKRMELQHYSFVKGLPYLKFLQ